MLALSGVDMGSRAVAGCLMGGFGRAVSGNSVNSGMGAVQRFHVEAVLGIVLLALVGGWGCGNQHHTASHTPAAEDAEATREAPREAVRREGKAQYLPRIAIVLGGRRLEVELARTPEQRARGLMFRTDLGPDEGMLFAFPRPQPLSFWMRNTPTALSIAFFDHDGRIVRIARMRPFDERNVESGAPAQFALEMPAGYFVRHGIRVGDRLRLLDPLPPVE